MEKTQSKATLNDGSMIDIEVQGKGPSVLISINAKPIRCYQGKITYRIFPMLKLQK